MKKHYFLTFLWVLLLLLTAGSTSAQYALSGSCGRRIQFNDDSTNLQWSVDTAQRVLTITGNGRMYDYDTDTKAPWYPWRSYINRLVLPNGLTEIGTYAMYYLDRLDSIQWGGTVQIIRDYAFYGCSGLLSLSFPNSLSNVNQYSFSNCSNLRTLNTGDGLQRISYRAFESCGNLRSVHTGENLTSIDSYAFRYCSKIQNIDFGNSPVDVGYYAFYTASSLKSLRGSRIKSIGDNAFYGCDSLVNLQLGDSLQYMYSRAFYGCHSLRGLHLPSTLTSMSGDCFAYAFVLDTITVDPANTTYNSNDNCNAVIHTSSNTLVLGCRRTVIPSTTTYIGSSAFLGCINLSSINIPIGVLGIQSSAFSDCSGLLSIILPEGLTTIGSNAFNSCSSLQFVNLPNSVTSVDCYAFNNCSSLTQPIYNEKLFARLPMSYSGSYAIPNNIETICCGAFRECDRLSSLTFPISVITIGNNAFYSCDSLQTVILPDSLITLGANAFQYCGSLSSITIPKRVTTIDSYTFNNCRSLQSAVLPSGLKTIGFYTFESCRSLSSIDIPDAVNHIGDFAFRYCSALTSITFPANLTSLGRKIIDGCSNLNTITWNVRYSSISTEDNYHPFSGVRPQITNFIFGDSVHVLPGYLCYNMTNLSSLSLGCNMDSIGEKVFDGCNSIKSIYWNVRSCKDPKMYYEAPFYSLRDSITTFTFGDSVRHIPAYLCHSMSGLHEVHIPKNVSSIGDYAFRYLGVLDSISVDPANTHYDSRGGCNALMETATNLLMLGCYKTQIPTNTEGIDACAFRNVRKLNTVNLPPSVTFIGKEAFNGCKDLKYLTLSKRIGAINDYAFQDCDSLYNITLPDSLWFIGLRAFANCSHIQTLTLPENVEVMDQYAFSGCSSMRSITCNAPEPPSIQETTFYGTSCPIYVKCSSISAYRNAPVWQDFGTRVSGLFFNTLTVRPNDYSFGRVYIVQQPDCEHTAILEADPILGYKFVSWQDTLGNVLSLDTRYEFYLDEDKSIIAEFVRDLNALEDVESHVRIWVNEHNVMLLTELNTPARLYDLMGHEVDAAAVEAGVETSLHAPGAGIYVVVTDNDKQKVIIK